MIKVRRLIGYCFIKIGNLPLKPRRVTQNQWQLGLVHHSSSIADTCFSPLLSECHYILMWRINNHCVFMRLLGIFQFPPWTMFTICKPKFKSIISLLANALSFILNACTWDNRKQQQHNNPGNLESVSLAMTVLLPVLFKHCAVYKHDWVLFPSCEYYLTRAHERMETTTTTTISWQLWIHVVDYDPFASVFFFASGFCHGEWCMPGDKGIVGDMKDPNIRHGVYFLHWF